jgi:hypothetical protein
LKPGINVERVELSTRSKFGPCGPKKTPVIARSRCIHTYIHPNIHPNRHAVFIKRMLILIKYYGQYFLFSDIKLSRHRKKKRVEDTQKRNKNLTKFTKRDLRVVDPSSVMKNIRTQKDVKK